MIFWFGLTKLDTTPATKAGVFFAIIKCDSKFQYYFNYYGY